MYPARQWKVRKRLRRSNRSQCLYQPNFVLLSQMKRIKITERVQRERCSPESPVTVVVRQLLGGQHSSLQTARAANSFQEEGIEPAPSAMSALHIRLRHVDTESWNALSCQLDCRKRLTQNDPCLIA